MLVRVSIRSLARSSRVSAPDLLGALRAAGIRFTLGGNGRMLVVEDDDLRAMLGTFPATAYIGAIAIEH